MICFTSNGRVYRWFRVDISTDRIMGQSMWGQVRRKNIVRRSLLLDTKSHSMTPHTLMISLCIKKGTPICCFGCVSTWPCVLRRCGEPVHVTCLGSGKYHAKSIYMPFSGFTQGREGSWHDLRLTPWITKYQDWQGRLKWRPHVGLLYLPWMTTVLSLAHGYWYTEHPTFLTLARPPTTCGFWIEL